MSPLIDISNDWAGLFVTPTTLTAYIGGQQGTPRGLLYANKLNFAPRLGIAKQIPRAGLVIRAGYGIFYTPVDMNTWCNNLHNVPIIFPETNQSDAFTPSIMSFNFAPAVVGRTVTSFTAFDPYQKPQYIQQWALSVQKSINTDTTFEIGYQGDRGFHLQRSHLINNAPPGPGLIQPRRPYGSATFLPGTEFPPDVIVVSNTIPVSTVNWLENTARSWYDAAFINLRRRYSSGLSLLANYTFAKNLSDAPDFRSPMFESAIPQDNRNLRAEKGLACDIRHRFVLTAVYDFRPVSRSGWAQTLTRNWQLSTVLSGAERLPVHDLRFWRYRELGHSAGRTSDSCELHGPAGIYGSNAHAGAMVQPISVRRACCEHFRQCRTQHGDWTRYDNSRFSYPPEFRHL